MSLEALERSDLSRLPGGIFTRAFIRAYAQEVGLDPDRTIQDFIAELPPDAATATAHSAAVEDGEKLESDRKAVATALRLALISLPIIVLVVYYGSHRGPLAEPPSSETWVPALRQRPGSRSPPQRWNLFQRRLNQPLRRPFVRRHPGFRWSSRRQARVGCRSRPMGVGCSSD